MTDRYEGANNWFGKQAALKELVDLGFAVASIAQMFEKGSYERELAMNASKGINRRIDYLYDSFVRLINAQSKDTEGA